MHLAELTTLRLGGPADRLLVAENSVEIIDAVRDVQEPVLVLAGGSNVVVADSGYPGTVVVLRTRGFDAVADGDAVALRVAAGEPWDDVVARAVAQGWSGLECLSGIPGSTGATPIQNVGAYGQEVVQTITSVRVYDRLSDRVVDFAPEHCGFAYRTSVFKHDDRYVVLEVSYRLARSTLSAPIRYDELAQTLGLPVGAQAPLDEVRAAVLALRAGKGMVLDQADPDTYSVGSFFTNPVLEPLEFEALRATADRIGQPPAWPAGADGSVKTSAAWLIEKTGFAKGYGHHGVAISTKHTLALTNRGTGTTDELLQLAREIRDAVRDTFGVTLVPEPTLVNCKL